MRQTKTDAPDAILELTGKKDHAKDFAGLT